MAVAYIAPAHSPEPPRVSPMSKPQVFQLHADDNVVVAGGILEADEAVEGSAIRPATRIPSGHKMAVKSIAAAH